ncbi:BfmA/BtgA family mobilization protein [Pedobacter nototheniae]|uniref:BfmA/BtgA family mobilization protein n=1 Tax=Pedobacter nototheniae TaxID=2488994 RepID=UPI0010386E9F|nr:BfmA/BtgA family mobilization protein [Pedobacter nototheniae]
MQKEKLNIKRETLRTIKYDSQIATKMEKVALKLGRPNRLIFAQMVEYFYRSKKDPLDINDELLKNTLLKSHKDYIGFIKTQESDLLIPIKREVDRMIRNQKDIVNFFNDQGKNTKSLRSEQKEVLTGQQNFDRKLSDIVSIMTGISATLSKKEHLKKQFHFIFSSYIKSRDAFGMMTPAKEKEELIQKIRNQIDFL